MAPPSGVKDFLGTLAQALCLTTLYGAVFLELMRAGRSGAQTRKPGQGPRAPTHPFQQSANTSVKCQMADISVSAPTYSSCCMFHFCLLGLQFLKDAKAFLRFRPWT